MNNNSLRPSTVSGPFSFVGARLGLPIGLAAAAALTFGTAPAAYAQTSAAHKHAAHAAAIHATAHGTRAAQTARAAQTGERLRNAAAARAERAAHAEAAAMAEASSRGDLAELRGTLPPAVLAGLAHARVPASSVSVVVERVGAPKPLISWNAAQPMLSASTMKLVTTYTGLSILGPQFRWYTDAYADGPVTPDGTLHGTLYLQGTGDPKLVPELAVDLVNQIRAKGITHIDGGLVLDKSYFAASTRDLPPFDDDASAPYNVGPDPLLYAFKSLNFTIKPTDDGTVAIDVLPPLANFTIDNRLTEARATCGEAGAAARPRMTTGPDGTLTASFVGRYPRNCGSLEANLAVLDHTDFSSRGFIGLWQQAGGTFHGTIGEGAVPKGARLVAQHESPPLADVVHDINKFSNNVMARNLYLTIGAVAEHPPATPEQSNRAIQGFLRKTHVAMPDLALENGAGLSRDEHVSALSLAALLQAANASPVSQVFTDSLPVAGVDGTMAHRLAGQGVDGNAHIKTGTLRDVRAIAGYVSATDGATYVVVSLINDPHAEAARAAHDALLEWIYNGMH